MQTILSWTEKIIKIITDWDAKIIKTKGRIGRKRKTADTRIRKTSQRTRGAKKAWGNWKNQSLEKRGRKNENCCRGASKTYDA